MPPCRIYWCALPVVAPLSPSPSSSSASSPSEAASSSGEESGSDEEESTFGQDEELAPSAEEMVKARLPLRRDANAQSTVMTGDLAEGLLVCPSPPLSEEPFPRGKQGVSAKRPLIEVISSLTIEE